jgi:hypothetical protein
MVGFVEMDTEDGNKNWLPILDDDNRLLCFTKRNGQVRVYQILSFIHSDPFLSIDSIRIPFVYSTFCPYSINHNSTEL